MLNFDMRIMPPALNTTVGIYGMENTLKPFSVISFLILSRPVVLPPHGPPVITILYIGNSVSTLASSWEVGYLKCLLGIRTEPAGSGVACLIASSKS